MTALEAPFEALGCKPPARSPEQGIAITKTCIAEIEAEIECLFQRYTELSDADESGTNEHLSSLMRELSRLRLQLLSFEVQKRGRN